MTGQFKHAFTWWRNAAPDAEPQMVINRFIAGMLVLLFNIWALPKGWLSGWPIFAATLYLAAGGVLAAHMLLRPNATTIRRLLALATDCGALSYEAHIGGGATAWLFAGYVWVIFGNGFRFGPRYHLYAMAAATASFSAMALVTPFWRDQPSLAVGGIFTIAGIPLYALTLIKRLSHARQQAEEANRAKSLFLTSVSHELRTPLNAVIGMGALLESSALNPEQMQMSRTIMTAARSLLGLINGILDMSRIEVGTLAITPRDFDLVPLLNEIRTIFASQAGLKGVQFNIHVTARTPLRLHGDASKLHEILLNLAGNAIKFTQTGSITVAVDMVARHDELVRLHFEVADTGIGIAPEAHERVFEMFTQADDTIVNRFGGTGLGLALVRKTVQLLGGEIGVQSQPGKGSIFWFELPLQSQSAAEDMSNRSTPLRALVFTGQSGMAAPLLGRLTEQGVRVEHIAAPLPGWPSATGATSVCLLAFTAAGTADEYSFVDVRRGPGEGLPDAETRLHYATLLHLPVTDAELANMLHLVASAPEASAVSTDTPPLAHKRFHVLVADDNATNRYVTEKILGSAGHVVTLANNGEDALDALDAQSFDIAVLDVNMPVMDGIEAAKIYRMSCAGAAAIPLIALTADATAATRERCLEAGMAACLVKPVEPAHLLAMIEELLQGTQTPEAPPERIISHPRVTEIAAHPRFRSNLNLPPATDTEILERLRKLGGDAFLAEVCELFRSEAQARIQELRTAVRLADVPSFRAHAHALRSVSANVGARHLYEICQPVQHISATELRENAQTWLDQVGAELKRVDLALADYCAARGAQSGH